MKEFLEYAENHAEDILGTLRHMVDMESFTADKASTYPSSKLTREPLCYHSRVVNDLRSASTVCQ